MIPLGLHRPQAGLDVPQALPTGQVRKGHAQKLIVTLEVPGSVIAAIPMDAFVEFVLRQKVHEL